MAASGPALPAIVNAQIFHRRTTPIEHQFTYRTSSWLVDIDNLPRRRLIAHFRAVDHFPEPPIAGETLRGRLERHLSGAGVEPPKGSVTVLTSPRVLGFVFNPISIFWCHDTDGALAYVVAEVHNTYGDRHCYVVDVDADGLATVAKEFYVSPFNQVDGDYRLRLPEPSRDGLVKLVVRLDRPSAGVFVAQLVGHARPATRWRVAQAQLTTPFAPLVVAGRIRLQGIRLWLRGLKIMPMPAHGRHTTRSTRRVLKGNQP